MQKYNQNFFIDILVSSITKQKLQFLLGLPEIFYLFPSILLNTFIKYFILYFIFLKSFISYNTTSLMEKKVEENRIFCEDHFVLYST